LKRFDSTALNVAGLALVLCFVVAILGHQTINHLGGIQFHSPAAIISAR